MDRAEAGGGSVVATYREIAEHFGYRGKHPDNVARMKAKRAGWPAEPQNHPLEPVRVRVPREVWEGAIKARERRLSAPRAPALKLVAGTATEAHESLLKPSETYLLTKAFGDALETVKEHIGRERERADRAEALVRELEAAAQAERDRARALEAERDAARGEVEWWTAGGPFERAWRALTRRRVR